MDGGEKRSGISHEEAAGLKKNAQPEGLQHGNDGGSVILRRDAARRALAFPPRGSSTAQGLVVNDADATTEIKELDVVGFFQILNQRGQLGCGFCKGTGLENLGADVRLHAPDFQMRKLRGDLIDFRRSVDADAELVFAFSSRNEFVRFGVHIGIHSNGNRGFYAEGTRDFIDAGEFALALDIEGVNALLERVGNLLTRLPNACKSAAPGLSTGFQNAEQLAARDDVESGPHFGEEVQNSEVGIGFDGVADEMVERCQRGIEAPVVFADRGGGVNIGRCAEAIGDFI